MKTIDKGSSKLDRHKNKIKREKKNKCANGKCEECSMQRHKQTIAHDNNSQSQSRHTVAFLTANHWTYNPCVNFKQRRGAGADEFLLKKKTWAALQTCSQHWTFLEIFDTNRRRLAFHLTFFSRFASFYCNFKDFNRKKGLFWYK